MKDLLKKIFLVLIVAGLGFSFSADNALPQPKVEYIPFQAGEKLKYALHFGSIHAGESVFEIKPDMKVIGGKPHYHVHVSGRSYKIFDPFYKVRDHYETFLNSETILPSVFIRDVEEGSYKKYEYYIFDRNNNRVKSNNKFHNVEKGTHDIISAFYFFRCIDFSKRKTGTAFEVKSFFEEEIFPLGVTYIGKKVLSTKFGKVQCMVFKPKLIEGRVFKDQEKMTIYVSDDKNQIPIRIESEVFLGTVKADLIEYSNLKYGFRSLQAFK